MEPPCSLQVCADSYLLQETDIIFLFVIATALFLARLPDDMSRVLYLAKRFEEATAYATVNVNSLEPHRLYPIFRAKRISIKYGPSVVLTLRISETSIVQLFLPKRYSEVMSDADMDRINSTPSHYIFVIRVCVIPPSPTCWLLNLKYTSLHS